MPESVIVSVAQGALRGREETSKCQKTYYSFRGVPYAKPPVGSLRFKVSARHPGVSEPIFNRLLDGNGISEFNFIYEGIFFRLMMGSPENEKRRGEAVAQTMFIDLPKIHRNVITTHVTHKSNDEVAVFLNHRYYEIQSVKQKSCFGSIFGRIPLYHGTSESWYVAWVQSQTFL
jgi:hypothetical protein